MTTGLTRRKRWMLAICAALLAVCLALFGTRKDLNVVVYNSTDRAFRDLTIFIGSEHHGVASLDARESVSVCFRAVTRPSDMRMIVDADPPLHWNAPSLATPSLSCVTLRVDEFGGVTMTLEKTWHARIAGWLE